MTVYWPHQTQNTRFVCSQFCSVSSPIHFHSLLCCSFVFFRPDLFFHVLIILIIIIIVSISWMLFHYSAFRLFGLFFLLFIPYYICCCCSCCSFTLSFFFIFVFVIFHFMFAFVSFMFSPNQMRFSIFCFGRFVCATYSDFSFPFVHHRRRRAKKKDYCLHLLILLYFCF